MPRWRYPAPARTPDRLQASADPPLSLENRKSLRPLPRSRAPLPPSRTPPSPLSPPNRLPPRGRSRPCRACRRACRHRRVRVPHGTMRNRLTMCSSHTRIQPGRFCSVSGQGSRRPAAQAKSRISRTKLRRRRETPTRRHGAGIPPSRERLSRTGQRSHPVMERRGRRHTRTWSRAPAHQPMWARPIARGHETDQPWIASWAQRRPKAAALPAWSVNRRSSSRMGSRWPRRAITFQSWTSRPAIRRPTAIPKYCGPLRERSWRRSRRQVLLPSMVVPRPWSRRTYRPLLERQRLERWTSGRHHPVQVVMFHVKHPQAVVRRWSLTRKRLSRTRQP